VLCNGQQFLIDSWNKNIDLNPGAQFPKRRKKFRVATHWDVMSSIAGDYGRDASRIGISRVDLVATIEQTPQSRRSGTATSSEEDAHN
tara:strand:+ start:854 stop:1117 length:264 start_codon:yes stop_codon:yes gene_type:complete